MVNRAMSLHSLNRQGTVQDAVGYVAEAADKGATKIVVLSVTEDGYLEGYGFGEVTTADLCLFGTFLQKRAMDVVCDGEDASGG